MICIEDVRLFIAMPLMMHAQSKLYDVESKACSQNEQQIERSLRVEAPEYFTLWLRRVSLS